MSSIENYMDLEVENVLPYNSKEKKKSQIEGMFDSIAHRYDMLNHLLSAGVDILWRKRAIREIGIIHPQYILDMATGTGDFAMEAMSLHPQKVTGVDLSQNMLNIAINKVKKSELQSTIEFIKGDSEQLTFADNSFDAITVGFGVRNFQNMERGLSELYRVCRPEGMIAILEPAFPPNPLVRALFTLHFRYITPFLGKILSKDGAAYQYLPNSVEAFPQGDAFCKLLERQGFRDTKYIPLTFGMCMLYLGKK